MSADGDENDAFSVGAGFVGGEVDIAIGVLAVDDFGVRWASDPHSFQASRDTTVRPDFDGGRTLQT
jgi:hypothetical protein